MSEFNTTPQLILLPAVDVADGKAVRMTQGEVGTETNYGDPVEAADDWARQGAEWIHLVDLDAAFGRGDNHAVIKRGDPPGARRQHRTVRRHPRRREPGTRPRHRRQTHQPRHRRAGEPGVGRARHRANTASPSPSASTCAGPRWRPAAGRKDGGDLFQVIDRLEAAGCARYVVTDVTRDGTLQRTRTSNC